MSTSTSTPREVDALKSMAGEIAEQVVKPAGNPLTLERDWQFDLVSSTDERAVYKKPRQIGYSWATALRVLMRAHIFPPNTYTAVFVSINREEAAEKIRYIGSFHEDMPKSVRKKMITDNKLTAELENGNRIISFPARAVRGLANVDLYLDEFAHIRDARNIYQGSEASTIRGNYGVTVGSTPFGRCAFDDMHRHAGTGEYKAFKAYTIYWWESPVLCKDPGMAKALAPGMCTEDRVYEFGMPSLIREYESLPLESFQREFECSSASTTDAVFNEDFLREHSDPDMPCAVLEVPDGESSVIQVEELVRTLIADLKGTVNLFDCFLGFDVGRKINATEIVVLNNVSGKHLKTIAYITLKRTSYPVQQAICNMIIRELPIKKAVVDAQGIGNQLSEALQMKWGVKVYPMNFTEVSKTEMVAGFIKGFEDNALTIYPTRRVYSHLTAVKKVFSVTGRILYHAVQVKDDADSKSHADIFWAMAMAIWGANEYTKGHIQITSRSPILILPHKSPGGFARFNRGIR